MNNMRKKEKPGFNRGHFPEGTVAVVKVFDDSSKIITVTGVFENGPNSWVLETDLPNLHSKGQYHGYNLSHVTQILKRGDGPCRVRESGTPALFYKEENYPGRCQVASKNKGEYVFLNLRHVVSTILKSNPRYAFLKEDHIVDMDAVVSALVKSGIVQRVTEWGLSKVNKRQLHKRLIKLIARHKLKRRVQQALEDKEMERIYVEDMERESAFA
jgi:hypothetical protein